ncbi:hypothetical protein PED39_00675 [Methanomassiliicoccales archaeon LGM-RCC1]|nr:hypothetical protein PED39_00675 [Methanomassiliicoccales archaeon LGM-RCC1]
MSNQINDTITVDLHDQIISDLPITDPDELEDILINAADRLTDGREPVILEALMNTLVDFYVFTMEPGNDEEDIGFLVSDIEDKVCDAVSFRKTMIDNGHTTSRMTKSLSRMTRTTISPRHGPPPSWPFC